MSAPLTPWEEMMLATDPVISAGRVIKVASLFYRGDGVTKLSMLRAVRGTTVLPDVWDRMMSGEQTAAAAVEAANTAAGAANTAAGAANTAAGTAKTAADTAKARADAAYNLAESGVNRPAVSRSSQLEVKNTVTQTDVLTLTASPVSGSAFRVRLAGQASAALLASAVTLRVYVGSNPAAQTLVLNGTLLGVLGSLVPFTADMDIQVRSGVFIATMVGRIAGTNLITVSESTAVLSGTGVKVTAQWSAANTTNRLLVETCTITQTA